ncbi:MAG: DUF89 family protein [Desulfobacterales bacterium]|nr:DUF89 family protein [Desulfobacterales bacterium]
MKAEAKCYECLERLVVQTAGLATNDHQLREQALVEGRKVFRKYFSTDAVTIDIAAKFQRVIREVSRNPDPYREMKEKEISVSRKIFGKIRSNYGDGLLDLIKFAVVGNGLDFFRPVDKVAGQMEQAVEFVIDDSNIFEEKFISAKKILYLADNAGELFFDMPLLNVMRKTARVIYVVKESPVQNDLTMEEIKLTKMEAEAGETMTTGADNPGVMWSDASEAFKEEYESSDLIFAKGMGFYEGLTELPPSNKVFHCLMAKCGAVSRSLGVPLGSYVALLR